MKPEVNTEETPLDLAGNGIWQRLPGESPQSYSAFAAYLELGDASLNEVAEHTGRSHRSVRHLSWRHNWMDRAAAYRQHVSQTYLATMQQERVRQTELAQMRDQLFRQELWEQRQTIRAVIRKGLHSLLDDPKSHIAAYEVARLMEIDFKSGSRATAPTGFTFDGPVPANPQFEAEMERTYGKPMPLDQLLDLMLLAHPDKEEMIRAKVNAAAAAGYPFSNPDLMKHLDPSEKPAPGSDSSSSSDCVPSSSSSSSSSNFTSTPESVPEALPSALDGSRATQHDRSADFQSAVSPISNRHTHENSNTTTDLAIPGNIASSSSSSASASTPTPAQPLDPEPETRNSELEPPSARPTQRPTCNVQPAAGIRPPLPPRLVNRYLDQATLRSHTAAMERYIDSTLASSSSDCVPSSSSSSSDSTAELTLAPEPAPDMPDATRNTQHERSADFQSAVSPISNRRTPENSKTTTDLAMPGNIASSSSDSASTPAQPTDPEPETRNAERGTPQAQLETRNPELGTGKTELETRNPKPGTPQAAPASTLQPLNASTTAPPQPATHPSSEPGTRNPELKK
jgi:hypothetical protein